MARSKLPKEVLEFFRKKEVLEFFREQGRRGGKLSAKARMEKITPERRSEIAKNAVKAREEKRRKRSEG